jgi:hypothetical protein
MPWLQSELHVDLLCGEKTFRRAMQTPILVLRRTVLGHLDMTPLAC